MTGETQGLFPALRDGLAEFRARIEGESGEHRNKLVQNIAGQEGIVPTVTAFVLKSLADILAWIYNAVDDIDEFVIQADAAVALLQLFGVGLQSVGEALDQEWPQGLDKASDVASTLGDIGTALAGISDVELPSIIPDPAVLTAIREDTRFLLGIRVDPDADPPRGSLDELLDDLGIQA